MSGLHRILRSVLSHRTLALLRWDIHFLRVRMFNALHGSEAKLRRRAALAPHPLYLNFGSGPRGLDLPSWINVDGFLDTNVHHQMDFSRPLPFANETFDGIFSEHVFEHFTREDGAVIMRECRRVMRPGGVLRIIVPDAGKIVRAYVEDPERLTAHRGVEAELPMAAVNMYAYQRYEHQCLYDWRLMRQTLCDAGFEDISQYRFGSGSIAALTIDHPKYEWESLYVEARNGAA